MRGLLRHSTVWRQSLLWAFVAINAVMLVRRSALEWPGAGGPATRDAVTASDDAFRRMLPHLPPHGRIGYLKTDFSRANAADLEAFFHAQYSLAPRVLVYGTAPDIVVAVAHGRSELPDVPAGFEQVQRFSNRLALYRRRP
jgi:hypothetical protein